METHTPGDANTPENPALSDALRIQVLERALLEAENRAQKYALEAQKAKEHLEELQQLRHDYESLRVQKGGFGFKTLLLWGFAGFLSGVVLCYLFFRPRDERALAFEHFRREALFPIEYAISRGHFDEADKILSTGLDNKEYGLIHPEIDMIRKVNSAAKRRCSGARE